MRLSLRIVAAAAVAALAAAPAAGKDGARARLTTALPLDAAPGTTLAVGWRVDVPDQSGGRQPFGAGGMFVRLLSRTGAPATTAFASGTEHADGRYAAEVTVPAGGIGGVRLGLRGWNDHGTADVLFPLENDPFASAGGARCDVSVLRATLNAFVGAFDRGDPRRLDGVFARDSVGRRGRRCRPRSSRRSRCRSCRRSRDRWR
jgi:hypothetical protein